MRQILWGFVKKILIAENCGRYINPIFADYQDHTGSTILFASIIFGFQIYCDFSGYSDIAIGTAKLFGFDLMQNFAYPFFSRNISEFWRRWHISLTTWFRDYIYFPLGGSRGNKLSVVRNTFIVFLVSGFWHGPAWTYVVYGALNGAYFLPVILKKNKTEYQGIIAQNTFFPNIKEFLLMLFNIYAIGYLWMMFRAQDLNHALSMYKKVFSFSLFYSIDTFNAKVIILLSIFLVFEWIGRKYDCPLYFVKNMNILNRWIIYIIVILSVFYFGNFNENEFIYFQF